MHCFSAVGAITVFAVLHKVAHVGKCSAAAVLAPVPLLGPVASSPHMVKQVADQLAVVPALGPRAGHPVFPLLARLVPVSPAVAATAERASAATVAAAVELLVAAVTDGDVMLL